MEARITEYVAAHTPPLPIASPPLPLLSLLTTSPTDAGVPLGYRAAGIRMRAAAVSPPLLLPSTSHRTNIPEAEMPPQKRACFATPSPRLEIRESSAAGRGLRSLRYDLRRHMMTGLTWEHRRTALATDREAVYARIAWTSSEERSAAIEAHTQLTTTLGRIATLEARDPEPQDGPAEAGSSS
ncbi:hypothetical protein Tco_0030166 [Tanacetum coccineum]